MSCNQGISINLWCETPPKADAPLLETAALLNNRKQWFTILQGPGRAHTVLSVTSSGPKAATRTKYFFNHVEQDQTRLERELTNVTAAHCACCRGSISSLRFLQSILLDPDPLGANTLKTLFNLTY